ncbi:aminoglycoside phosphotransferase [Nocardiopsis sp. CNR-923]|uniref:maltokinase N-terminal cap-like domain-containing protein n=1 Tax=Nocardiopsis sp. CNR-923 TaxID=1904965 RepID=UPI000968FA54|nr:phosphotransferase [Nocardiopsis sp. CNR-923]OLT26753.1 aminoglycoside phosphotransferase [Nocardiopsis sp. CNR-923]
MSELEELLAAWLPRQRWFSGKGVPIHDLRVASRHTLRPARADAPSLDVLVVEAKQRGRYSRYQVLLGARPHRSLPRELAAETIGVCRMAGGRPRAVYDASHDRELNAVLLERFSAPAAPGDTAGVRFRTLPGAPVRVGAHGRVLTGEQSNTSLVFGEDYVLKTFRRLWPGRNPDLELTMALTGSPYVARTCGWIEADLPGYREPTTLAMLQAYVPQATDGWVLATRSVRALVGGAAADAETAFAAEAERLGRTTAEVHRSLARALPTDVLTPVAATELAEAMIERLAMASAEVPELTRHAPQVMDAYAEFARVREPLPIQRIHGDYHLGQVLRTATGWVLLDFEGEPTVSVSERQCLASPLRDVAGMLRSFDYAAGYLLIRHPDDSALEWAARSWSRNNRAAFCAGYADAGGPDPDQHLTALRAFEFDKAVYEVLYEARNRPNWLRVPLDSIAAAASGATAAAAPPVPG